MSLRRMVRISGVSSRRRPRFLALQLLNVTENADAQRETTRP